MTRYPYALKKAITDAIDAQELAAAEKARVFLSKLAGHEIELEFIHEALAELHPLILAYIAGRDAREAGLALTYEEQAAALRTREIRPL